MGSQSATPCLICLFGLIALSLLFSISWQIKALRDSNMLQITQTGTQHTTCFLKVVYLTFPSSVLSLSSAFFRVRSLYL